MYCRRKHHLQLSTQTLGSVRCHHCHLRWQAGWSFEYIYYLYGITNIQSTKIDGLILTLPLNQVVGFIAAQFK